MISYRTETLHKLSVSMSPSVTFVWKMPMRWPFCGNGYLEIGHRKMNGKSYGICVRKRHRWLAIFRLFEWLIFMCDDHSIKPTWHNISLHIRIGRLKSKRSVKHGSRRRPVPTHVSLLAVSPYYNRCSTKISWRLTKACTSHQQCSLLSKKE